MVQFLGSEGWVRRIDNDHLLAYRLQDTRGGIFVALFLNVAEVGGFLLFVLQTFLMGIEGDIILLWMDFAGEVGNLGYIVQRQSLLHAACQFDYRLFAHAIDKQVGTAVAQDAGAYAVLPVVVVGEAAHARLDTAQEDGYVGV